MSVQLLDQLSANFSGVTYGVVALVAAVTILARLSQRRSNLSAFPTVGSSTWLGSCWAGYKFLVNAQTVIQQGYEKHKSAPFKVAEFNHWTVILSERRLLEELAMASDTDFSFLEAIDDHIQVRYTLGQETVDDLYHAAILRSQITRNIQVQYPEVRDEMMTSFSELLGLRGNEWKSIETLNTVERIICRTSNRLFVGLPLCRDSNWVDLNLRYTFDAIQGGVIVGLFPISMRAMAARLFTKVPGNIMRGVKYLRPVIEKRQRCLNIYGTKWDDMPNDLLTMLMSEAEGQEWPVERLANHILFLNFGAIHTSANLFTQALFHLAANPQHIQPLREEVEGIVEKDGWSKDALGKMRKIDSFLRECQRVEGLNIVTLSRKAMRDFTFSDGTFIPKGTYVGAATLALHHDESLYDNPEVFEPFRFAKMREEKGMESKYQFASTSTDYLAFGHGKQACPGRFFAAYVLKTMLAYVVTTYDVRLEDNATPPKNWRFGTFIEANHYTKIMFRNRVD